MCVCVFVFGVKVNADINVTRFMIILRSIYICCCWRPFLLNTGFLIISFLTSKQEDGEPAGSANPDNPKLCSVNY